MEVRGGVCVCVCVSVCSCELTTKATAVGGLLQIKANNFQIDSQTCTRFSGKVGHEPKDS